jgi:hypothetical protein
MTDCIICLNEINDIIFTTDCNHTMYCKKCAVEIVLTNQLPTKCYICRKDDISIMGKCNGEFCCSLLNANDEDKKIILENGKYPECKKCFEFYMLPREERVNYPIIYREFDVLLKYYINRSIKKIDDTLIESS